MLSSTMLKKIALLLCLLVTSATTSALTLSGLINSHDPSTLTKDGDTYFHFTTGQGIWYSTSTNLTTWTGGPAPVFSTPPAWVMSKAPTFNGEFWAPDVIHMNGYYYLYYSFTAAFGTSTSAIGVARTVSLKNPVWQDLGMVVESFGGTSEINAIDPALFRDVDGKVYMSYGSFFGGIGAVEINQSTGKMIGNVTKIYGGNHVDIEAPYIVRNGDYYYLFVNRGACCKAAISTYYIEVSRSTSIFGAYSGTRTLLPNVDGKYKGPGHVGLLRQDGCDYVSTHYYDLNDNGNAKLDLLKMTFSGGWPTLTRNFTVGTCGGVSNGLYKITARHSSKALAVDTVQTSVNGTLVNLVEQYTYSGAKNQQWYVINQGNGYYSLINANSLQSLDVFNVLTTAGASIAQWPYLGGTGQKWALTNTSGYYKIASQLSALPLDVTGAGTANDVKVVQWNNTGATNQQWIFTQVN